MISLRVSASNPPFSLDDGDSRLAISDRSSAKTCHLEFYSWYRLGGCRQHDCPLLAIPINKNNRTSSVMRG